MSKSEHTEEAGYRLKHALDSTCVNRCSQKFNIMFESKHFYTSSPLDKAILAGDVFLFQICRIEMTGAPFFLNLIHPIFFANSNFAPTNNRTTRSTPQTITERMYVGKRGSNRLLERSTDLLFGVTWKRIRRNELIKKTHEIPFFCKKL